MSLDIKNNDAYKTIGEIAKELDLINKYTGKLQTHTIRYWERQFKQIKPVLGPGKRRYYSKENLKIIKSIKYLLKEKGFTINGVKNMLNNQTNELLDPNADLGIYNSKIDKTNNIKERLKNISKIIKELKNLK
jgi:DNA-binding transcriptional MerR regulator